MIFSAVTSQEANVWHQPGPPAGSPSRVPQQGPLPGLPAGAADAPTWLAASAPGGVPVAPAPPRLGPPLQRLRLPRAAAAHGKSKAVRRGAAAPHDRFACARSASAQVRDAEPSRAEPSRAEPRRSPTGARQDNIHKEKTRPAGRPRSDRNRLLP